MVENSTKVSVSEKNGSSRTAHLQPVIDFLKALGNPPAQPEGFTFDRDGYGSFHFEQPLAIDQLQTRFSFPPTMLLTAGAVQDTRNFVGITQHIAQGPPIQLNLSV